MEPFILHFFTGTMAFRTSRASQTWKGAQFPDAFFRHKRSCKNGIAGLAAKNAAYARNIQRAATRRDTRRERAEKIRRGKTDWEAAKGAETSGRETHETAATAKQPGAGSTAMQRELGFGNRAEYQACGAISAGDEKSHALAAGI